MEINNDFQWYALFVKKGKESEIIENFKRKQEKSKELFDKVNFFWFEKGYIFVNCKMNFHLLSFFYSIPDVIIFLDHNRKDSFDKLPICLSGLDLNNFFSFKERYQENKKIIINEKKVIKKQNSLKVDDLILIKEGSLKGTTGYVLEVDNRKNSLKINIDFLGRTVQVSVESSNCEKIK